jgi:hypothetical protein
MFNSSYFKNTELAKEFKISSVTVGRYIEQSIGGTNNLQIINIRGKPRIKRNEFNFNVIKSLTSNESRFKNKGLVNNSVLDASAYKTFNHKQLLEIISNLESKKYIPIKYAYMANEKELWPNYGESTDRLLDQRKSLKENLMDQLEYIRKLASESGKKINIIQLGTSYKLISKEFINKLSSYDLINGYIVVDMNETALEIEEQEVTKVIDKKIFKKINYDFERSYCKNFIYQEINSLDNAENGVINLFMVLGANLSNYPSYSKVIECLSDISSRDDILLYDLVVYHNELMYISNFSKGTNRYHFLTKIPSLLGFDMDKITLNTEYNPETMIRSVFFEVTENTNVKIENLYEGKNITLTFKKNERVTVMKTKLTDFVYDYGMLKRKSYQMIKSTFSTNEKFVTIMAKKTKLF